MSRLIIRSWRGEAGSSRERVFFFNPFLPSFSLGLSERHRAPRMSNREYSDFPDNDDLSVLWQDCEMLIWI